MCLSGKWSVAPRISPHNLLEKTIEAVVHDSPQQPSPLPCTRPTLSRSLTISTLCRRTRERRRPVCLSASDFRRVAPFCASRSSSAISARKRTRMPCHATAARTCSPRVHCPIWLHTPVHVFPCNLFPASPSVHGNARSRPGHPTRQRWVAFAPDYRP